MINKEGVMARTHAEQLLRTLIQTHVPTLPPRQQHALARWVLGAVLAGRANGPSIVSALVTAGVARATTLEEAWDAWLAAPAQQTTDPPTAGAPPVVSPLACGADLLRWSMALWAGGPLVLGMDASLRRDDLVLLRTSVRYRGTAIPIAWVIAPANTPGAWEPHWERMLRWIATVVPTGVSVLVLADQGLWSPRLWAAIRSHGFHPVMRVHATATFAPTGQRRQPIKSLVPTPGAGWIGSGVAFTHAPKRVPGTLAAMWVEGYDEPWALLTDIPPDQLDAGWYALRAWDEAGYRQSTSMGWDWQRGQLPDPDAVAWQYLVVAVATLWALVVGTRIEDAEQARVPAGQLRHAPTTLGPPQPHRWSGTATRVICLLQRGCQKLRWLLARGRQWVRVWLRPEPLPVMLYRVLFHIHCPSQCLKRP